MRTRSAKQALPAAEPSVKPVKKTFDDDDDQYEVVQEEIPSKEAPAAEQESEEDDDDEAPVEEVSNKSSKKQLAEDAKKKKAEQKAAQEKRKQAEQERLEKKRQEAEKAAIKKEIKESKKAFKAAKRQAQAEAAGAEEGSSSDAEMVELEEDDLDADLDQADDQATAGPSRLDPSLFAEVFSKKAKKAKSILKKREMTAEEAEEDARRKRQLKAQRRGGIVKGRDGLPMKRLADGTVVRSLASHSASAAGKKKTNFDDAEEDDGEEKGPLDPVVRPTALDPTVSLPSAKVRGFKKRKLGMTTPADGGLQATKAQLPKKAATISKEDDPLGLNDPAFLPGGQFYRGGDKRQRLTGGKGRKDPKDTGAGVPGELARQGFRGAGGRRDALSSFSSRQTGGPSLGFARSLA